jgi:hypothetical protein
LLLFSPLEISSMTAATAVTLPSVSEVLGGVVVVILIGLVENF